MTSHDMNSELLRRYLLDELDVEEADTLEKRLLREDELFELAEAVEGDLLAACARGELPRAQCGSLLQRLAASPGGRARIALARDLGTLAGRQEERRGILLPFRYPRPFHRPAGRVAALAASLLVVVGGLWLGRQTALPGEGTIAREKAPVQAITSPQPPPVDPSMEEQDRPADQIATGTGDEPAVSIEEEPPPAPSPGAPAPGRIAEERPPQPSAPTALLHTAVIQIASLMRTRSAGGPLVAQEIPAETRLVEIRLPLEEWVPGEHASFSAVVEGTDQEVWRTEDAAVSMIEESPYVILFIPASELQEGKYWIELRGLTPEGDSDLIGELQIEIRRPT